VTSAAEDEISYGVGNDFFRLWLDEPMNYTCAVFDGTDDLEEAQLAKLAVLYDYAGVRQDTRVLDIGCGWGANLAYLAVERQVRDVHGITLSAAQHAEILSQNLPGVTAIRTDYRDYEPAARFGALISIEMIEHVCRPEHVRSGEAASRYRDFFHRAWRWTVPGARFGLQNILCDHVPRRAEDVRELAWFSRRIFPGGIAPRLEDIVRSVDPYWEIIELRTRRLDYRRTCAHWRDRLRQHEAFIRATWGDGLFADYDRYLTTCIHSFDQRYVSLAQWSLRRLDAAA
jgi:cyclopropane-fatty-acyl-phospholipid synthase